MYTVTKFIPYDHLSLSLRQATPRSSLQPNTRLLYTHTHTHAHTHQKQDITTHVLAFRRYIGTMDIALNIPLTTYVPTLNHPCNTVLIECELKFLTFARYFGKGHQALHQYFTLFDIAVF